MDTPKTLIEAVTYYSDESLCRAVMVQVKWPSGRITCPECGCGKCKPMASRPKYIRCGDCHKQFSYKVGTIFEDSPLSLSVWFVAVWCIANAKNGISSCELARATGVTQKTAWFMLHRIRTAMETGTFQKLSGTCETDETYIVMPTKPPQGVRATTALLRKLVKVPKSEVDALEAQKAKQPKRKKK